MDTTDKPLAYHAAVRHLNRVQRNCTVRCLDASDLRRGARLWVSVRRYARRLGVDPAAVIVEVDGGAVPNSYNKGYGGETTCARLTDKGWRVVRSRARSVARGDAGRCRATLPQVDDRPAADYPPAWILGRKVAPRRYVGRLILDI